MYLTLFAVEIKFAWQSLIRTRPSATVRQKNLKTAFFTPNASCVFCPIHTTQEQNSKIKQSPIILDFSVFDENSVKKITWLLWRHPAVLKSSVFKCFQSTRKRKASIFKFLRFRGGWMWAVGVTVQIKLRWPISQVWCGHWLRLHGTTVEWSTEIFGTPQ